MHSQSEELEILNAVGVESGSSLLGIGPYVSERSPGPDCGVLEDAVESCHDCIALVDLNGKVAYVNFAGICHLGFEGCFNSHTTAWTQLWSCDCTDLIDYSLESARSGRGCRIYVYRPGARCVPQWWDMAVSPVFDRNGTLTQIFCVCREITDALRTGPRSCDTR